ncbi:Hypp1906 [Branchiostoma lanceolatum]|uniref:Hypp1906 protein n=1 Tax=Branchiostoma lanceolatum TaxID=7740 RepID=A0A8K0EMW4_BRALA|nr:Hypp1906 [Branchiostoma lanceolatum]
MAPERQDLGTELLLVVEFVLVNVLVDGFLHVVLEGLEMGKCLEGDSLGRELLLEVLPRLVNPPVVEDGFLLTGPCLLDKLSHTKEAVVEDAAQSSPLGCS